MKKVILLLSFLISSAHATDITFINGGNTQSPTTVFGLALKNAVKGNAKWEQASSCRDVQSLYRKTKNSVIIYNTTNDFADRNANTPCEHERFTAQNTVIISAMPIKICKAKDHNKAFNDQRVTMGIASMLANSRYEADWNKNNNLNLKLVAYGGSAGVATAVINKEIDYGFIASPLASKQERDGKLECVYSTDAKSPLFVGKHFRLAIPDFEIITVAYTNSTDPEVLSRLKAAAKSAEFTAWLNNNESSANTAPTNQDLERINGFVSKMMAAWGTK
jgi:hypothetical protein